MFDVALNHYNITMYKASEKAEICILSSKPVIINEWVKKTEQEN